MPVVRTSGRKNDREADRMRPYTENALGESTRSDPLFRTPRTIANPLTTSSSDEGSGTGAVVSWSVAVPR
jgi:hypothetical protein